MNKAVLKQKTILTMALIAVILLCLVCSAFGIVYAEEASVNKLNIVHISDLHYYPTYMCYKQSAPDYNDSAMVDKSKLESKLVIESSSIIKKLFEDIENKAPDYLLVTGDLSSDGERDALIDIANALRDLQNRIRSKGKENFQIFVIAGNHDISNPNATDYRELGGKQTQSVSRFDFAKIFAGLGYRDLSEAEAKLYYKDDEFDSENLIYLPYNTENGRYVHSTNAKNIEFKYMSMVDNATELQDGDLTYVAKIKDTNNTIIAIDGIVSGKVGGKIQASVFEWLDSLRSTRDMSQNTNVGYDMSTSNDTVNKQYTREKFIDGNIITLTHQNVLPHFSMQEQWTKNYLYSNWEQVRDYFLQIGVKYNFSGHMHANDIASYCNYAGFNLYDIETGSPIGYGASYREVNVEFYMSGASNLWQTPLSVNNVDVQLLIDKNYLTNNKTGEFETNIENGKISNLSGYINDRLYAQMLDNVLDNIIKKINKENAVEYMIKLLESKFSEGELGELLNDNIDVLRTVFENLYDKIQGECLSDFNYTGDKEFLQEEHNKLRAYVYKFAKSVIDIEVARDYTIQDMFVEAYTTHLKGGENKQISDNLNLEQGLKYMQTGEFISTVVGLANDKKSGILPLVQNILKSNFDLTYNIKEQDKIKLNIILKGYFNCTLDSVNLDKIIQKVAGDKLDSVPSSLLDKAVNGLVMNNVAKGIGENFGNVICSLVTDSSDDSVNNVQGKVVYSQSDDYSHYAEGKKRGASIADGRCPSMLTMTYGDNVYTDRELVWFTDKRVQNSTVQICEGEKFDSKNLVSYLDIKTDCKIYAVDFPLADIGIFATYTTKELARHTASISGLKPNTTYTYRVGHLKVKEYAENIEYFEKLDSEEKSNIEEEFWSGVYTFKTPELLERSPFELLITTDMQGITETAYQNVSKLLKASKNVSDLGYDFMLNLGDMVDNGRNNNQWQYLLNGSRDIFATLPQVIAAGNHEQTKFAVSEGYEPSSSAVVTEDYSSLALHFNIGAQSYFSFDYKGVHFIVLDTNDMENENLSFKQVSWLEEDLKQNKDNLVVVAMHKGIYSAGPHRNDSEIVSMRKTLSRLFSEYKVELVLQGHDHIYSESFFLDAEGKKTKTPVYRQGAPINNNNGGVLYITMGTSGDKFYQFDKNTDDFINKGKMFHTPALKNPTFGKLVFDGENISFYSYQYDVAKDRIEQLKLFNNNQIGLIISIITAVIITLGLTALIVVILIKHKKQIRECKKENLQFTESDKHTE